MGSPFLSNTVQQAALLIDCRGDWNCDTCNPFSGLLLAYSLTLKKMFGLCYPERTKFERFAFTFQWNNSLDFIKKTQW